MPRKIEKKCCVCGCTYTIYCPTCREAVNQPTWKNSFCSENCRDVYNVTAGYFGKAYSAQEAKALLDMCDLSDKEHFTQATQRLIDEIYKEDNIVEEDVKENENLNEINNTDVTNYKIESGSSDNDKLYEGSSTVSMNSDELIKTSAYNTVEQVTKAKNFKKKNKRK